MCLLGCDLALLALLVQGSLGLTVASTFAFAVSAFYLDCLIIDVHAGDERRAGVHYRRGELFLTLGGRVGGARCLRGSI